MLKTSCKVSFSVPAYSVVYGHHPSSVVPLSRGRWKAVQKGRDPFTGKSPAKVQQRRDTELPAERVRRLRAHREQILASTLMHGAAWERENAGQLSISSLLSITNDKHARKTLIRRFVYDNNLELTFAVRTPSSQNKWQKRKGARAVKNIEHAVDQDNRLTPEAATVYRALSARCN